MAIYLTKELAAHLAAEKPDEYTGCLEYGRYSAQEVAGGEFAVYAWVHNMARRIGVMTGDGKHGLHATLAGYGRTCICEQWMAPGVGGPLTDHLVLGGWREHAGMRTS